ncbi:MAG: glycine dehydrogenase (aminomethyl-transferring), partial [Myxococcales bacterium]|nr:glycine dehydrogenase (aminomethyl-transferring) [Myxococcales bacterium]
MAESASIPSFLAPNDTFVRRHVGPCAEELAQMLAVVGVPSLEALIDQTIPEAIRMDGPLQLRGIDDFVPGDRAAGEHELLARLQVLANRNQVRKSYIGLGYYGCITPPVVQRNILENPGWYTAYTPYQAEISQGRLEALINFQTMVCDLTGMSLANASLLDEGTAAAEAMTLARRTAKKAPADAAFLLHHDCHPQTIGVVRTR